MKARNSEEDKMKKICLNQKTVGKIAFTLMM